jgi:hypothetical protein
MAIFGVGSNWDGTELKSRFFSEGKFILGWNEESANDLYSVLSTLKVGDILYIKSNQPGSRTIKVKGVGIISKNFMNCLSDGEYGSTGISDWESLFIRVKWLHQEEFSITIPENEGKLTNIRAATIYEESLPFVQENILQKIIGPVTRVK